MPPEKRAAGFYPIMRFATLSFFPGRFALRWCSAAGGHHHRGTVQRVGSRSFERTLDRLTALGSSQRIDARAAGDMRRIQSHRGIDVTDRHAMEEEAAYHTTIVVLPPVRGADRCGDDDMIYECAVRLIPPHLPTDSLGSARRHWLPFRHSCATPRRQRRGRTHRAYAAFCDSPGTRFPPHCRPRNPCSRSFRRHEEALFGIGHAPPVMELGTAPRTGPD